MNQEAAKTVFSAGAIRGD